MSTSRQPASGSRRQPPAVYRRRRLVALLVLAAVLAAIAWGVSAAVTWLGGSDAGAAGSSAAGETGGTGAPVADKDAAPGDVAADDAADAAVDAVPTACEAQYVDLDLVLDPPAPTAGETADLRLTLTNSGPVPCLLDAGPAALAATVSSGDDTVWTTEHCDPETDNELLLDTEAAHETVVRWPGTRSAAGCTDGQPAATSGTYRASAGLAGASRSADESVVFTLR